MTKKPPGLNQVQRKEDQERGFHSFRGKGVVISL